MANRAADRGVAWPPHRLLPGPLVHRPARPRLGPQVSRLSRPLVPHPVCWSSESWHPLLRGSSLKRCRCFWCPPRVGIPHSAGLSFSSTADRFTPWHNLAAPRDSPLPGRQCSHWSASAQQSCVSVAGLAEGTQVALGPTVCGSGARILAHLPPCATDPNPHPALKSPSAKPVFCSLRCPSWHLSFWPCGRVLN